MLADKPEADERRQLFATTHWSVVLAARDDASTQGAEALEALCRTYWPALYAFVRSSGYSPEDAQDLTQEFFARLLARDYLRAVAREKGRFRTFLRMAFKRFLAKEWQRVRAAKRGHGVLPLPFDTVAAETGIGIEAMAARTPEAVYDRHWAFTLLGETVARLEREYRAAGKSSEFKALRPHLTAERGVIPYPELAAALGTTEGAARVAVHRLRKRFRETFREVIGETVSRPDELDEEVRYMIEVLGSQEGG